MHIKTDSIAFLDIFQCYFYPHDLKRFITKQTNAKKYDDWNDGFNLIEMKKEKEKIFSNKRIYCANV